jgi:hypothetical protein
MWKFGQMDMNRVGFEFLAVVTMKICVFLDKKPRSLEDVSDLPNHPVTYPRKRKISRLFRIEYEYKTYT